ncbi:hypothetical protein T484DRAFT_1815894 [Baffinella frigidus]|nr:hypothetical protein T484DRAFT_1815894 [Cryptophyta sp. CCMP2293]
MLSQVHDLNNALVETPYPLPVSYALMDAHVFVTSAGVIGPNKQVDHDVSLLIPEVWSRMREEERDANWLIANGFLDKIDDFEVDGKTVPASLLGFRINEKFVNQFFGRVLANPSTVFDEDVIRPEKQDMKIFAEGMKTITDTNARVANMYLEDGGAEMACPPLKALLHIMAKGESP